MLVGVSLQLYPAKFILELILLQFFAIKSFCGLWLVRCQISRNIELLTPLYIYKYFDKVNICHHW